MNGLKAKTNQNRLLLQAGPCLIYLVAYCISFIKISLIKNIHTFFSLS